MSVTKALMICSGYIKKRHFRLGQISTPTFYPRETRHGSSNLLLSAGILAQYKTLHEEI